MSRPSSGKEVAAAPRGGDHSAGTWPLRPAVSPVPPWRQGGHLWPVGSQQPRARSAAGLPHKVIRGQDAGLERDEAAR